MKLPYRVMGIDPGTNLAGMSVLSYGMLVVSEHWDLRGGTVGQRLASFYHKLTEAVERYRPDAIAVENQFFNIKFGLKSLAPVIQVRGIVEMVASTHGILVHRIAPTEAKKAVAGSGKATKEDVAQAVRKLTGLRTSSTDETDAVAIAWAAWTIHGVPGEPS